MADEPAPLAPAARLGATLARLLISAYLGLAAAFGLWHRETLEADWPWLMTLKAYPAAEWLAGGLFLALLACAGADWLRRRRACFAGRPWLSAAGAAVLLLCLSFVPLAVLAAPGAPSPAAAWGGTERLALALALGLLAGLGPPRPREIAVALSVSVIVQSLVGIAQFVKQSSVGLLVLGELPGLDLRWRGVSVVDVGGFHWLRAYGLSAHPNVLGGYLAVALVLLLGVVCARDLPRRGRAAVWAAIALGSVGLLLTFSRAAWLGFATALGLLAWMYWPQVRQAVRVPRGREWFAVAAAILLLAGPAAVVGPLLVTRVTGGASPLEARSIAEREYYLGVAWNLMWQSPWRGVGVDNFLLAARSYPGETPDEASNAFVHNVALMAGVELGLPAGLGWLALGAAAVLSAWLAVRRARAQAAVPDGWGAATTAAWLALWVVALFDYYPWSALRNGMIWPLLLGLWVAAWPRLLPARRAPAPTEAARLAHRRTGAPHR